MRLRQVSPHVWQVRIWRVTRLHTWLVTEEDGLSIVDTGYPFMARDVLRAAELVGAGPVKRVLLTHGHPDHAGGAPFLARQLGVPVLAHDREMPFLQGERKYPRVPHLLQPGHPDLAEPLPAAADDELLEVGGLKPYEAPGHTPGHVVYFHEQDSVLLAGDLFKVERGRLRRLGHMFSADREEATRSEALLEKLRPQRVETSHGGGVEGAAARL